MSMKKGERAVFVVDKSVGYGAASPAKTPLNSAFSALLQPNVGLIFDIELVDFTNVGANTLAMNFDEKMAEALRRKNVGNGYYKAKRTDRSSTLYKGAIDVAQGEMYSYGLLKQEQIQPLKKIMVDASNNLVAGILMDKKPDYTMILNTCEAVLALDKNNQKAQLRRVNAMIQLDKGEETEWIVELKQLSTSKDAAIVKGAAESLRTVIEEKKKRDLALSKMFQKGLQKMAEEPEPVKPLTAAKKAQSPSSAVAASTAAAKAAAAAAASAASAASPAAASPISSYLPIVGAFAVGACMVAFGLRKLWGWRQSRSDNA